MLNKEARCAGCGKVVVGPGNVRISIGIVGGKDSKDAFLEREVWGILHKSCFNRAIDSPEAVIEEIQAARQKKKSA